MTIVTSFKRNESGFVLLAVIWVLAAMVLFVGFVASSTERIQANVFADTKEVQRRMEFLGTESTLIYLGATQRMSYAGLTIMPQDEDTLGDEFNPFSHELFAVQGNELRMDSRPYLGLGESRFSIQDTGGLISLRLDAGGDHIRLRMLLEYIGIEDDQATLLLGALEDYIDHDNIASLNGVERGGYPQGALPPTNRFLTSPTQIASVYGWKKALGDQYPFFLREVTAHVGNKDNFNTMTRLGIQTLGEMSEAAIDIIMEHRETNAYTSVNDVNQATGTLIPSDPLSFGSTPDPYMRLALWHEDSRQEHWIGIRFTPMSGYAPWQIDYRVKQVRLAYLPNNKLSNQPDVAFTASAPDSDIFR